MHHSLHTGMELFTSIIIENRCPKSRQIVVTSPQIDITDVYLSSAEDILLPVTTLFVQNAMKWDLWEAIWTIKTICSVPSTALWWIIQRLWNCVVSENKPKAIPGLHFIPPFTGSTYSAQTFCYLTSIWTLDSVHLSHYESEMFLISLTLSGHWLVKLISNLLWSVCCCCTKVDWNNTKIRKFKRLCK